MEHNLGVAIAFACGIQLAMSGLFSVMLGLEDPFATRAGFCSGYEGSVDNIRVNELAEATKELLLQMERDAETAW